MAEAVQYNEGVIKSITPKLTSNGYHEKFEAGGREQYKFEVSFEGDIPSGSCSSAKVIPPYKAGDAVLYTSKQTSRGIWYSIKQKKDEEKKSSYNDPASIRASAMGMAHEVTSELISGLGSTKAIDLKSVLAYSKHFYEIFMDGVTTKDGLYPKRSCLLAAIKLHPIIPKADSARKMYEHVTDIYNDMMIMVNAVSKPKEG